MEKKKERISVPSYTLCEELVNSISHGVAAAFSIWGLVMLIIKASKVGAMAVTTVTLFGTTMILLYTISCIYHALSPRITGKKVMRVIDHGNVFLLVFGTIIPIALVGMKGICGWIYFGIVGFITLLGIIFSAIDVEKNEKIEVMCHLFNGWSAVIFIKPLIAGVGGTGLILIILGGVMYSIGALLYGLGSTKKYMHSVFHFFCIFGTIFHYIAIYLYVL